MLTPQLVGTSAITYNYKPLHSYYKKKNLRSALIDVVHVLLESNCFIFCRPFCLSTVLAAVLSELLERNMSHCMVLQVKLFDSKCTPFMIGYEPFYLKHNLSTYQNTW